MAVPIARLLHEAIAAVCPIQGVSLGRRDDKTTWRITFTPEATAAQQASARDILTAFDITQAPPEPSPLDKLKSFLAANPDVETMLK